MTTPLPPVPPSPAPSFPIAWQHHYDDENHHYPQQRMLSSAKPVPVADIKPDTHTSKRTFNTHSCLYEQYRQRYKMILVDGGWLCSKHRADKIQTLSHAHNTQPSREQLLSHTQHCFLLLASTIFTVHGNNIHSHNCQRDDITRRSKVNKHGRKMFVTHNRATLASQLNPHTHTKNTRNHKSSIMLRQLHCKCFRRDIINTPHDDGMLWSVVNYNSLRKLLYNELLTLRKVIFYMTLQCCLKMLQFTQDTEKKGI